MIALNRQWPLISLLGIVFGLTSPALADPPTTAPTTLPAVKEFTSSQYRIRLKYPADWIVPDTQPRGQVFSAKTPPFNGDANNFGVATLRSDQATHSSTDDAYLADMAATLADFIFKNGGEHVKITSDKLGELPARTISFQRNTPSGAIRGFCTVAVKGRVEYVFNFVAPASAFDSLSPEVNELFKSFEIPD